MFKIIMIAALSLLMLTPALAQPAPQVVVHNGSVMQVFNTAPGTIEIRYLLPRPSLWRVVAPGTLLVSGWWQGRQLNAIANVFTACGPVRYPVTGGIDRGGVLTLAGPAPIVDPWCNVVGTAWTDNSVLIFMPATD